MLMILANTPYLLSCGCFHSVQLYFIYNTVFSPSNPQRVMFIFDVITSFCSVLYGRSVIVFLRPNPSSAHSPGLNV